MIIELETSEHWRQAFNCMKYLRPDLRLSAMLENRESLLERDFHLIGFFDAGDIVGVVSYVIQPHLSRNNEFWIHDLVIMPEFRNKGISKKLLDHLEIKAREKKCSRMVVHTRIDKDLAEPYYQGKMAYEKYATVLTKEFK